MKEEDYTFSNIINKLKEFNKDLSIRSLRERYNSPSFFEMMSISRKENQHSAFIKWLLQGDDIFVNSKYSPLMGLLDIILERAAQQGKESEINPQVKNAILSRTLKINNINAICERCIGDLNVIKQSKDRIDIHIICDVDGIKDITQFEFVIENKIGSKEGDEKLKKITNDKKDPIISNYNDAKQTVRYVLGTSYNINDKPDNINNHDQLQQFYVFLTPISNSKLSNYGDLDEDETCASKRFIHINYQDIVNYIIEPLLSSNNLSDRVKVFLNEYLNNLSMPCEDEADNIKNTIIMATYNEDIETIKNFWKKYQNLVLYCAIMKKALIIDGYPSRQDLFNDYIKYYIKNKKNQKNQCVNKYFSEVQKGKMNSIKVTVNNHNYKVTNVSNPNTKIERITELEELFVLLDFFEQNQNLLLAAMKILSDSDEKKPDSDINFEIVRDVYNALTNPKDYTKYVMKVSGSYLTAKDKVKNPIRMNKRETVVSFIENLGVEITKDNNSSNGNISMAFFNDYFAREVALESIGDKDPKRYNAYSWNSDKKKYVNQGPANNANKKVENGEISLYFSNQWGSLDSGEGTFDKFLIMVNGEKKDGEKKIEEKKSANDENIVINEQLKKIRDKFKVLSWEDYCTEKDKSEEKTSEFDSSPSGEVTDDKK